MGNEKQRGSVFEDQGGSGVHTEQVQSGGYRLPVGEPIRLDIGAGDVKTPGWIRLDFDVERPDPHKIHAKPEATYQTAPDIVCDIRDIPLPDNCADEARAIHVIEHLYPWEALGAVKEWMRLLKPGAQLAIECPCLDKIMKLMEVPQIPPYLTMWGLYGDPRLNDPLMMHKWCFTMGQLERLMTQAGLVEIRSEPVHHHSPIRDMRLVGIKPQGERRIVLPTDSDNGDH